MALSRALIRAGGFLQSLAAPVMGRGDLAELNRRQYARPDIIGLFSSDDYVDSGLTSSEAAVLERARLRPGTLLDLGAGGGREAVALARMGFRVTCVDYSPVLLERTIAHAERHGLRIETMVRDLDAQDLGAGPFDAAWISSQMYSSIPGGSGRVRLLKRVAAALKPGGVFLCQFRWGGPRRTRIGEMARRAAALLSGNFRYEPGDELLGGAEFAHSFSSEAALRREFARGGFEVLDLIFDVASRGGWAVLEKGR